MSKTHKISHLKKRIAELEKQLERRQSTPTPLRVSKVRFIPIHATIMVDMRNFDMNEPQIMERVADRLVHDLADSEVFRQNVKIDHRSIDPRLPEDLAFRAAIMVAPYEGDVWSD